MFSQIADLLIRTAFGFFVYALLLRFYMQWLRAPFRNPVGQFVTALTDWAVRPARRLIPGLFGVIIVQVIISWVNPYAPLAPVFDALTRPFYAVFRRFVPPIGNVDLSPLFVLLLAQIILILLESVARLIQAPL